MAETDAGPRPDPVLSPFLAFLEGFKSLLAAMVAIGATAAVGSMATTLGPPWPNRLAVASLTGVTSMILLAWLFLTMRRQAIATYVGRMPLKMVITAACGLAYFALWATLVHEISGANNVGVRSIRPEVQKVMAEDHLTTQQVLEGAGFDPDLIWTYSWVEASRLALLAAWIAFFCGVSSVLATFLLALEAQSVDGGTAPWGGGPKP